MIAAYSPILVLLVLEGLEAWKPRPLSPARVCGALGGIRLLDASRGAFGATTAPHAAHRRRATSGAGGARVRWSSSAGGAYRDHGIARSRYAAFAGDSTGDRTARARGTVGRRRLARARRGHGIRGAAR